MYLYTSARLETRKASLSLTKEPEPWTAEDTGG